MKPGFYRLIQNVNNPEHSTNGGNVQRGADQNEQDVMPFQGQSCAIQNGFDSIGTLRARYTQLIPHPQMLPTDASSLFHCGLPAKLRFLQGRYFFLHNSLNALLWRPLL